MKKRLLSILLTVVMVLSLLPTAAFAVTVDNTYQPGTYVASAPGHDDALVSVTLTLAQQDETVVISDLQADGSTQTPRFWAMVEEAGLLDSIKNANGTTGVDVVSGATQSSRAVLSAVEQALSQATSTISGSGTASDPYQIVTAAQLTAFAAAVDGGNTYADQYVALGASIDLSGIDSWNPIGTEEGAAVFQGTFDGRGYTISGLTINASVTAGDSYHGLFSVLGSSAVVRNLNLAGADVHVENTSGKAYAGALAGATTKPATSAHSVIGTRIDVCSATGSVSALTSGDALVYAGGMIGFGQIGTAITNCWTDVNVSAVANNTNKNSMAGGIIGSSGNYSDSIFAGGSGTEGDPYLIATEEQLRNFAASLTSKIDYTGKYVALANDISVSSAAWTPIGGSQYLFNGTFDGRGYTINGLTLGAEDKPFALDNENLYIGLFGILGAKAVVKNVNLTNVAFYTTYAATAYLGGIAGITQGSTTSGDYTGAIIDACSVSGILYLNNTKGNHFVGGLVGMQYKGATINSRVSIRATGIVDSGDLAEVGGLAGLNNRGLIANCWTDNELLYASGNRENGNEGMAVVSNLVACNAGALVNCYASGDLTTREFSTYAGMVSGWVTGIGKSYACWYDLGSTMINGANTDNPVTMNPVAAIGTKVASGVTEEGDVYTGGLVDRMTVYDAAGYAAIADGLNASFAAFPIDITAYGIDSTALKTWTYDAGKNLVTFGAQSATITYVQPDCEKVEKPEQTMQDGIWYGRDDGKTTVVKITVKNNAVTKTEVLSGESSGEAYEAALAKAKYKAIYGDFSHYEQADPSRFAGGSGTEKDPYRIANEAQLRYLAESINADVDWKGVCFKQTADIKLTGGDWLPIGWSLSGEVNGKKTLICAYPFRGKTA